MECLLNEIKDLGLAEWITFLSGLVIPALGMFMSIY